MEAITKGVRMSTAYDTYLQNHIQNVEIGYDWILNHIEHDKINDIFPDLRTDELPAQILPRFRKLRAGSADALSGYP